METIAIPAQMIEIPNNSRKLSFSLRNSAAASATKIGSKASKG
jgi:hypothetical protein